MRFVAAAALATAFVMMSAPSADARNYPCSKGKGGIAGCLGDKYLCKDGSTSASKRKCQRRSDVTKKLDIFTVRGEREEN